MQTRNRFAIALLARRTKKHTTLRQLEKEIGMPRATISRIENGYQMDLDSFFRLCRWMKINPSKAYDLTRD